MLLVPSFAAGGAERNLVTLANELARGGRHVELVACDGRGPLRAGILGQVPVTDLGKPRARTALPALRAHVRRRAPAGLLSTVEHTNVLTVLATRGTPHLPVALRIATQLVDPGGGGAMSLTARMARRLYPRADALVVNSHGAADDLAGFLGVDRRRITVLPNLTVPAGTEHGPGSSHPWFAPGEPPVIVSVGRLDPLKELSVLIAAFARVRVQRPVRLLIIGDGPCRDELTRQVAAAELEDDVAFLGHRADPRPELRSARLFALSSRVEGMPNAMIEAMACGTGVVATDCRNGPRELLEGGRHGRLVPVGDVTAFASALHAGIDDPRVAPASAWRGHTVEAGTAAYAAFLDRLVSVGS